MSRGTFHNGQHSNHMKGAAHPNLVGGADRSWFVMCIPDMISQAGACCLTVVHTLQPTGLVLVFLFVLHQLALLASVVDWNCCW